MLSQIPTNNSLNRESAISIFRYDFHAQKEWQYTIEIKNIGASVLTIGEHAETNGNIIALSGQLILVATGMIVAGFGLKIRNRPLSKKFCSFIRSQDFDKCSFLFN